MYIQGKSAYTEDGNKIIGEEEGNVEDKGITILYEPNDGQKVSFKEEKDNRPTLDEHESRSQRFMYGCGGRKMSAVEIIKV
jgi:hypothetical protein